MVGSVEGNFFQSVSKGVKFRGRSVMVWGMFSVDEVEPLVRLNGKVNSNVYQNLLQQLSHYEYPPINQQFVCKIMLRVTLPNVA